MKEISSWSQKDKEIITLNVDLDDIQFSDDEWE